jgi:hypothetical protein
VVRKKITQVERAVIADAVAVIALELAARFCADVLEESYFGWDKTRFKAAWEHHLLRARGQFALARSIGKQREAMRAAVAKAFSA